MTGRLAASVRREPPLRRGTETSKRAIANIIDITPNPPRRLVGDGRRRRDEVYTLSKLVKWDPTRAASCAVTARAPGCTG